MCGCQGELAKLVGAGGEEFEEVEVAEDLELLADSVGDVALAARMKVIGLGCKLPATNSKLLYEFRRDAKISALYAALDRRPIGENRNFTKLGP